MLTERQNKKYDAFFESTAENEILDQRSTLMVQLAAAFIIGCYR